MTKLDSNHPLIEEMTRWRRHIHAHPETAFEEVETSAFVAEKLESFGLEVHRGLAKTGVVGTLSNGDGPAIALRADMDALDMNERSNVPHSSRHEGKMHGCGHDGHTAMLLGAAAYLAQNKDFTGTVHFIFQPAEENQGGGRVMVEEGLFEKFPVQSVFGLHNWPEMPLGTMAMREGPMMAACDTLEVTIKGKGCHAAMPHLGIDPMVMAAQVIQALQTVASRTFHPQQAVVVSVTQIEGGDTWNVIPDDVTLRGTVRSFDEEVRNRLPGEIERIIKGTCSALGGDCDIKYMKGYPATVNHAAETQLCAEAAIKTVGAQNVDHAPIPSMGAEDFSYMLQAKPGCYVWLGTGGMPGGCLLHNPGYDFNDEALSVGTQYWVELVRHILK